MLNCSERFSFTCTDWLPRAVVTWPKAASLKLVSGLSKCGVLDRLNDSPRNSRLVRSVILNRRNIEKSISNKPGPLRTFRPTFPNVFGRGAENTDVSNHNCPGPTAPNICGDPFTLGRLMFPGAFRLAELMLKSRGNPLSHVQRPFNCQPPNKSF